jgi:DNA-directed RNA polymerase specialized sigma24 family protein
VVALRPRPETGIKAEYITKVALTSPENPLSFAPEVVQETTGIGYIKTLKSRRFQKPFSLEHWPTQCKSRTLYNHRKKRQV